MRIAGELPEDVRGQGEYGPVAIDAQLPFDVAMNESGFKVHVACINTLGIRQSVRLAAKPVPSLFTNNKPTFQSLKDCWLMMLRNSNGLPSILRFVGFTTLDTIKNLSPSYLDANKL
jgi:hypothetical protein